jgi:hypothetical protein
VRDPPLPVRSLCFIDDEDIHKIGQLGQ